MNMANKKGVFEEKKKEYFAAGKKRRGEILDAVVEVSGLTRKGAIKHFRRLQTRTAFHEERRGRPTYYLPDTIAALHDVWEIGSEACGENLHPMIGEYIDTQVVRGTWRHSDEATGKLRAMSLGSVKKHVGAFTRTRISFGGKSTTTKSTTISMVPIRMDGWSTAETGVLQIDTVAHCGASTAGDYVFTVNGTDVATLWGTRHAQWNKGQEATKESLASMRESAPFAWTEVHPDSGSEFINAHCLAYAQGTGLRMTRSRPYHKNDNCFVEERNGHVVRVYVGFERLDAREVVVALNNLYDVLTPYLNHFVASGRTVSKERIGAKWKVTREKVSQTPYQRVLGRDDVPEEVKDVLRTTHALLDPKEMRDNIDRLRKRVFDVLKRYGPKK
jgi:hypothetical protein